MTNEDTFASLIAGIVLRVSGEDIQAYVLEDIVKNTTESKDLSMTISEMRSMEKQSGDFGMEIVGTLLLPILVEAAKQLWAAYIKRLSEKTGEALADYTIDEIKTVVKRIWSKNEIVINADNFEKLVLQTAEKEGLSSEQKNKLIVVLQSVLLKDELAKL